MSASWGVDSATLNLTALRRRPACGQQTGVAVTARVRFGAGGRGSCSWARSCSSACPDTIAARSPLAGDHPSSGAEVDRKTGALVRRQRPQYEESTGNPHTRTLTRLSLAMPGCLDAGCWMPGCLARPDECPTRSACRYVFSRCLQGDPLSVVGEFVGARDRCLRCGGGGLIIPSVSSRSPLERKSGDPERGRAESEVGVSGGTSCRHPAAVKRLSRAKQGGIRARFRLSGPTVGASGHDTWGTHGDCPFGMLLLSRCCAGRASHSLGGNVRSGERRQGTSGGPALRVHLHLPARRTFQR